MLGLGLALRLGGNAYHKTGEATAKALSPVVLADLISGLARVLLPTDLRLYLDCLTDFTSQVLTNSPNCTISFNCLGRFEDWRVKATPSSETCRGSGDIFTAGCDARSVHDDNQIAFVMARQSDH